MDTHKQSINTEAALLKALKVDSIHEIVGNADVRHRALAIARSLTRDNLLRLLEDVPALQSVLNDVIRSASLASISKDETKRVRWRVLQGIAESGALTGPEILEAFRMLQQIEREERADMAGIVKTVLSGLGALAVLAILLVTGRDIS